MKKVKLVLIEWLDSAQPVPAWQHLGALSDNDYKPIKCASVGWLIHADKKVKVLAPNMGDMEDESNIQASGIIRIATCSVIKISNLHEAC